MVGPRVRVLLRHPFLSRPGAVRAVGSRAQSDSPAGKPEEVFTGWAGKQEEIGMILDSSNDAMGMCVGVTTARRG